MAHKLDIERLQTTIATQNDAPSMLQTAYNSWQLGAGDGTGPSGSGDPLSHLERIVEEFARRMAGVEARFRVDIEERVRASVLADISEQFEGRYFRRREEGGLSARPEVSWDQDPMREDADDEEEDADGEEMDADSEDENPELQQALADSLRGQNQDEGAAKDTTQREHSDDNSDYLYE